MTGRWEDDEILRQLRAVLDAKALSVTLAQIQALPVVRP